MVAQQLLQHTVLLVFVASRQPPLLPVLLRHQQLQLLHSQRITPAAIKQFMCHNSNVCEHVCIVKGEHESHVRLSMMEQCITGCLLAAAAAVLRR
jgi:hypothetical protein